MTSLPTEEKNRDAARFPPDENRRNLANFDEKNRDAARFLTAEFLKNLRLLMVADSSTTHTHRWAQWFASRGSDVTVLSHAPDAIENVRVVQFPAQKHWYHRIPKLRMLLDYSPFQKLIRQLDPQL